MGAWQAGLAHYWQISMSWGRGMVGCWLGSTGCGLPCGVSCGAPRGVCCGVSRGVCCGVSRGVSRGVSCGVLLGVMAAFSGCQKADTAPPALAVVSAASATPALPPASAPPLPAAPASMTTLPMANTPISAASAAVATAAPAPTASPTLGSAPALPADILAFRKKRDDCDHFRGEEPYDAKRAAFLKAALARTCTGTDKALAALRQRYLDRPALLDALKAYEDRIE